MVTATAAEVDGWLMDVKYGTPEPAHAPLARPVPYDGDPAWITHPHLADLPAVGPHLAQAWRSA